jgi:hypothetical protein
MIQPIYIFERDIVTCPSCGGIRFLVTQHLSRTADLIRADGLGDLVTTPFDPNNYNESLILTCCGCSINYQPQCGIACTEDGRFNELSAYDEHSLDEVEWPARGQNTKEL